MSHFLITQKIEYPKYVATINGRQIWIEAPAEEDRIITDTGCAGREIWSGNIGDQS